MDVDSWGVVSTRGGSGFDVRVTKSLVQRAMLLLDAFLKACEKRGYKKETPANRWDRETHIIVLGKRICVKLREKTRRQDRKPNTKAKRSWENQKYEYVSTGVLTLEVDGRAFADAAGTPVEKRLHDVMVFVVRRAVEARRREIQAEQRRQRELEIERQRAELDRLKQEERQRVEDLYLQAENWERSRQIRSYLEAVRAFVVNRDGAVLPGSKAETWLAWAMAQADRLDPLSPIPASVLDTPDPAPG